MFYKRNVPNWERMVRTLMGIGLAAAGLLIFKMTALGIGLAAVGAAALLTGSVGYCPACAMVGRQPVETTPTESRP